MGKKVDLNKKNVYGFKKNKHNNFSNNSSSSTVNNENFNTSQTSQDDFSNVKSVPDDVIKAVIRKPIFFKVLLPFVFIFFPIIIMMILILLLYNGSSSDTTGYYDSVNRCNMVTVVDTGCNGNGRDCSNKYDGEVSFEKYVAGVVAAEVGGAGRDEKLLDYYKVLAIAARSVFLASTRGNCTVSGNSTFQAYIDIEESGAKELINRAVEETKGYVLVNSSNNVVSTMYSSACVVNMVDGNYVIRYGNKYFDQDMFQSVPVSWDSDVSPFKKFLAHWYSLVDHDSTDYSNKKCPSNHDFGMSQIGALYLILEKGYNYNEILRYYYGNDFELKTINKSTSDDIDGFITPVEHATCTSQYGCRMLNGSYDFHRGLDMAIAAGTSIYASKSGTVVEVERNVPGYNEAQSYGNYILISHDDGTRTRYAHMLYNSIPSKIKVGYNVMQGDLIGSVGSTGHSTGPHLHYEVYVNGEPVDPSNYIDSNLVNNFENCKGGSVAPSKCGR